MSKSPTRIDTILYTKSSEKTTASVEKELDVPDPPAEVAKAILEEEENEGS